MSNIALTKGERYTLARQGLVTVITDSTDSAEAEKRINNNLTLSGSGTRKLVINASNTSYDAFVHFASNTLDFSVGIKGTTNQFTISKNANPQNPGTSVTALRIPDMTNPKVHFDHGIVVTGSASVNGTLAVTGSLNIANTVRYRGEIYSEFTFTAAGNYTAGAWYNVVNSSQLVEGMYIIQGFVATYNAGSYIYDHKFASVPFYWYNPNITNDNLSPTYLPAVIGSGHARNNRALPSFRLQLTSQPPVDGKLYLQFNPGVDNWTGINSTGGKTFYVHLKRIG